MKKRIFLLSAIFSYATVAQETHNPIGHHTDGVKELEASHHEVSAPTIDLSTSTDRKLGVASVMVQVSDRVYVENHLFHALEGTVGLAGIGYDFIGHQNLKLIGSGYGSYGEHKAGGLGLRLLGRKDLTNDFYLLTDIQIAQTFTPRHGLNNGRTFLDPSHISLGWKKFQFGPAVEYLHHGLTEKHLGGHITPLEEHEKKLETDESHEFGKGFRLFYEPNHNFGFGYRLSHSAKSTEHIVGAEYKFGHIRFWKKN
jgi:hypothetical protein